MPSSALALNTAPDRLDAALPMAIHRLDQENFEALFRQASR